MDDPLDAAELPAIKKALSAGGWLPALSPRLATIFQTRFDAARRVNNRHVVLVFTAIFDLYWFAQRQFAPDILFISALLRFAVFTPFALLFCILKPRPWVYELGLLCIPLGASLITIYLCLHTMEMVAQPEIYGTPLILLYGGLLLRLRLPAMIVNAVITTAAYVAGVMSCAMLPHDEIGTLIFLQLAAAIAVITFNLQIETRSRRIFLLACEERIRRSLVAEQNRGLLRETQTDALTQLANRRCFDETLAVQWVSALESSQPISLIMIDIDHFKKFNDTYGHVMGDDCLRRIAGALRAATRPADLMARYGGEEFAVILPGTDGEAGLAVAQRLLAGVAELSLPHEGIGAGATVSISLGLATGYPDHAQSARILVEEADRNLYAAKRGGRNRIATDPSSGRNLAEEFLRR